MGDPMDSEGSRPRLVCNFSGHGRLACFKTQVPHPEADQKSSKPEAGSVFLLRDDSPLFGPKPVRELLIKSHALFTILQKHNLNENKHIDNSIDHRHRIFDVDPSSLNLVHASRAYRLFLQDCTLELQSYEGDDKEETQKLSALFYSLELIFHLAEILNFDQDSSPLLPKLQKWICYHFSDTVDEADIVMKSRSDESNPNFWRAVTRLIIQGKCLEAKNVLGLHSKKDSPAIKTLRQLLVTKPEIQASGHTSAMINFGLQWEAWRREVNSQILSGVFNSGDPQCLQLAELLAGDMKAIKLVYNNCRAWYQHIVCHLTYWEPTVQIFQLGDHALKFVELYEAERALDRILLALFETDIYKVIELLQGFSESGWASLHLTDLFHHAGLLVNLVSQDQKVGENLREDLLVQYGSLLASNDDLFQMGLAYLDHSPNQGRGHVEQILQARKLGSNDSVEMLLNEARKRHLGQTEQIICTVMSRRAVYEKNLGEALKWAIRAENHALASSIAELVLRKMAIDETYSVSEVLSTLGTSAASSGHLAFLVKYDEFLLRYAGDSKREAVFILMNLVTSGISPPYFLHVLLKKAAEAVKNRDHDLSSTDLCSILSVLEELEVTAQILSDRDTKASYASLASSEREIREILAQAIRRAEIAELAVK